MSRRRSKERLDTGAPEWMTTFSDLVTLLLTFFILLYSFSTLDAQKFKSIAQSLQSALTGPSGLTIFDNDSPPGDVPIEEIVPSPDSNGEILSEEIQNMLDIVSDFVEREGLEAEVTLRADRRGVIIEIKDTILFDPGKAELKKNSREILDKITLLIQIRNKIVRHTDNVPINTYPFPTNWGCQLFVLQLLFVTLLRKGR